MTNLAIIPARSGSKGLPDKNIKELCGKPLIAYTIKAALTSRVFDTIMVSTDSERYALIAKKYGAEVPFLRSERSSSDKASTWDAVLEVIEKYELIGRTYDSIAVLQPTSPFRREGDIKNAYAIMEKNNATEVVSVCECEHSPVLCNTLSDNLCMDKFILPADNKRRQDQKTYYRLNGAIYILSVEELKKNRTIIYHDKCFACIMPAERSIDIDTPLDFKIAEAVMKSANDINAPSALYAKNK